MSILGEVMSKPVSKRSGAGATFAVFGWIKMRTGFFRAAAYGESLRLSCESGG